MHSSPSKSRLGELRLLSLERNAASRRPQESQTDSDSVSDSTSQTQSQKRRSRARYRRHARQHLYRDGKGIAHDFALAAEWYGKATANGLQLAQCELADLYREGAGVAQDFALAAEWYGKAAAQGYDFAQCKLAGLYRNLDCDGTGVARGVTRAAAEDRD